MLLRCSGTGVGSREGFVEGPPVTSVVGVYSVGTFVFSLACDCAFSRQSSILGTQLVEECLPG